MKQRIELDEGDIKRAIDAYLLKSGFSNVNDIRFASEAFGPVSGLSATAYVDTAPAERDEEDGL